MDRRKIPSPIEKDNWPRKARNRRSVSEQEGKLRDGAGEVVSEWKEALLKSLWNIGLGRSPGKWGKRI